MGFTGFAVLPCRFHSDASVASRGSGALADALETLGAFERGNVSGLCRMGGKSARLCSEVSSGYKRIHGGRIWLGAAEPPLILVRSAARTRGQTRVNSGEIGRASCRERGCRYV